MIGKGKGRKGAVWVARRVPDGYISGHANAARIRQFPLNDPKKETLYAPDVISFAREKGWFGGRDEEFSFADTYSPTDFGARRFCDARVWCMFRRAAPSQKIPVSLGRRARTSRRAASALDQARPQGSVSDVMGFMRDHFEGTPLDMTQGRRRGAVRPPLPLAADDLEVDGVEYLNERAISTQQTGFSFVTQSRAWLPDPIGGVLWFGVDDTYSTVYFPVYAGVQRGAARTGPSGPASFDEVTVGLRVLGLQPGRELRLLALRRHDPGHPEGPARARGEVPRRAAGGRRGRRGALRAVARAWPATT